MKIFIKNPCKYCLTRPACRKVCQDHSKYLDRVEVIIGSIILFIIISIAITFSYHLWGVKIATAKYLVIAGWFLCYYFAIVKLIKEEDRSFTELKNYQQALVVILSPWGELTMALIDFLSIDKPVHNFCFRYIKHLNQSNGKEQSQDSYTRKAH